MDRAIRSAIRQPFRLGSPRTDPPDSQLSLSDRTRDSCLLFIYRSRCIFHAAPANNRRANIRPCYVGRPCTGRPNISPGNASSGDHPKFRRLPSQFPADTEKLSPVFYWPTAPSICFESNRIARTLSSKVAEDVRLSPFGRDAFTNRKFPIASPLNGALKGE